MKNKEQLPKDYRPFETIVLCGNTLINVEKIIDDKGFTPILIGKDENNPPLIWLKAKTKTGTIELIRKNKALLNIISVNIYKNEKQMDVILNNSGEKHIVLQIENIYEFPVISKFDLRTIGYAVYGDKNELKIGNSFMVNSLFQAKNLIGM